MEQHLPQPPAYIDRVKQLNQAIFFCYNQSSEKLPVSISNGFTFKDDKTIYFNTAHLPVTECIWNVFAAELHFYKKNIPFSIVMHGIAVITNTEKGLVEFMIQNTEYFDHPAYKSDNGLFSSLFKPYIYFYRKSSELLSHTFKRKTTTGAFN